MSYTATAAATSTTTNAHPTIAMSSNYYQGGQPQGTSGQQGQPQLPNGTGQSLPYPGFPQQAFNPQQQQQFAQWAYQQMMFQQQQLGFQPHGPVQNPYLTPQQQTLQLQLFQQQQQQQFLMQQQAAAAAQHQFPQPPQPPYARENNGSKSSLHSDRGSSRSRTNSANHSSAGDAHKARARTTSGKSSKTAPGHGGGHSRSATGSESGSRARSINGRSSPPLPPPGHRHRVDSTGSNPTSPVSPVSLTRPGASHNSSGASVKSNGSLPSPTSGVPSSNAATTNQKSGRPAARPSPLSQGSSAASAPNAKPTSKETSAPATSQRPSPSPAPNDMPVPTAAMQKSGGLKGRLKRALSFSALDEVTKHDEEKLGSRRQAVNAKLASEGQQPASIPRSSSHAPSTSNSTISSLASGSTVPEPVARVPTEGSIRSTTTAQQAPKKRSLFNSKFNRSTDNMSLSSTVSSASVMIRKLGSVGKLVRRNSLMGISNMFKDKDKNKAGSDNEDAGKKKKDKKKSAKGNQAEASVSHATVEVEAGSHSPTSSAGQDDMVGLSPAAKLARQHTLKSRAQEAAQAKAEQDANGTPSTWEKNTATRSQLSPGVQRKSVVGEFGTGQQDWSPVDDDLSDEDTTVEGHGADRGAAPAGGLQPSQFEWRDPVTMDDSDEDEEEDSPFDGEDDTIRIRGQDESEELDEPWAVGIRRSIERSRKPSKGILKNANSYAQSQFDGPPQAPFSRVRTNSNDSAPPMGAEPGPLARIPSPDPDHIDGLHRSDSASIRHSSSHQRSLSTSSSASRPESLLPPLSFDTSDTASLGSFLSTGSTVKERPTSLYSNADFNASAPALGTHNSEQTSLQSDRGHPAHPNLAVLRSATAPLARSKKLTYAPNLSVYHTFSPLTYDRRSEPATCNRLTPALAQRIKEELNSYKMEEMEVHPASRQHTHFFV